MSNNRADMPRVLVIIVTYNGEKWAERCFGSLLRSTVRADLMVVDNGSTDRTLAVARELCPEATIIETGANLGFGKANNIGLRHALEHGYDYAYLLNQDAWVEPDTIETLISAQHRHNQFGILSPMQMTAGLETPDPYFGECCKEWNCKGFAADAAAGTLGELYEAGFIMAAHWLVAREALIRVGGFAPIFPHYGEDNNYLDRARYHGLKAGICPRALAVHDRAGREESSAGKCRRIYASYFLPRVCDINRASTFTALAGGLWMACAVGLKYIFKYRSLIPLRSLAKCFAAIPAVVRTRRETKLPGSTYL